MLEVENNNTDKLKEVENSYSKEIQALKDEIVKFEEIKQQFEVIKQENEVLQSQKEENNELKYD